MMLLLMLAEAKKMNEGEKKKDKNKNGNRKAGSPNVEHSFIKCWFRFYHAERIGVLLC